MKVLFLKDHHNYKAGDKDDLHDDLGNYLLKMGVVEPQKEKVEMPDGSEKQITGPAAKKEIPVKKEKVEKSTAKEKVEK